MPAVALFKEKTARPARPCSLTGAASGKEGQFGLGPIG